MRLPSASSVRADFLRRGFVLVPDFLGRDEVLPLYTVAMKLLRQCGTTVVRSADGQVLWYRVVTGEPIEREGAPLFNLYSSPDLLGWLRDLADTPALGLSAHLRSAVNVNCLHRPGHGYPWHQDAVPYTCLLFLTSLPEHVGGEFLIRAADGALLTIRPVAGTLVAMDGARCPHAVAPLKASALRLSIPMVYPCEIVARPTGLDEHLYGAASS
jgi:2OG-Fe(II) oxygenase superfamily